MSSTIITWRSLASQNAGVLSKGDHIQIYAGEQEVAFLLLVGRPLREPIAQYGPFVMNTQEEIEQAISDYKNEWLVWSDDYKQSATRLLYVKSRLQKPNGSFRA